MLQIASFDDAETLLARFAPANLPRPAYTLEHITRAMDFLGNPQNKLRVIHVAGTSGKTSTCYYLAALLGQAGKKVGLSVSPHIEALSERVQINLTPPPERAFCSDLASFADLVSQSGIVLTRFEFLAAFAYWEFARRGVDYAVVEVGLGGTLDATNVVDNPRKVCVITDIGLDHQEVLGDSLAEIAGNKAGIIGLHNKVFCYDQGQEVMDVIADRAKQRQADLHIIDQELGDDFAELPLFQRRNFGLARAAAAEVLAQGGVAQLGAGALQRAAVTHIPARMEPFTVAGKKVILDGAHNAQKLAALRDSLQAMYPGQPVAALAAFKAKQASRVEQATQVLTGLANHLIVTTYGHPNTAEPYGEDPELVAALCKVHGFWNVEVVAEPERAFRRLLARPEPILLVTGSFYLFNRIRPLLKQAEK
ncbi:MAG: bifunctional folylpolyglutamate synthase/dihydrofolate synthase [Candidatus Saccharimonadales bacterium]